MTRSYLTTVISGGCHRITGHWPAKCAGLSGSRTRRRVPTVRCKLDGKCNTLPGMCAERQCNAGEQPACGAAYDAARNFTVDA